MRSRVVTSDPATRTERDRWQDPLFERAARVRGAPRRPLLKLDSCKARIGLSHQSASFALRDYWRAGGALVAIVRCIFQLPSGCRWRIRKSLPLYVTSLP